MNQPADPGFEIPVLSSGGPSYQYDPTGSPWTFSGDAGVAGNNSAFTQGNPSAPQGSQVAFIQITGSASQSVTLATGTYSISLEAAQRAIGSSNQTIEIWSTNALVGTFTPSGTSYSAYTTGTFFEAAGAHTIEILGLDPQGGDNTALVDEVSFVAVQANQPTDPGFETPSEGSGTTAYKYDPTGSAWTFSGYAGLTGNASSFTADNPNAPQGSQVAFIQITGSISQSFTVAPGIYDVNLLAAQRGIGSSNQTIQVFVDGQLVSSINPTGTSYASYTSGSFVIGTGGSHTLTFQGLDPLGGDNTALIDEVSVQNVTANQPLDAGFESPFAGPSAYQYNATGSAWTFSGDAGVAGNGSGFTANNPNAPQGNQVAFIQITGSASQSVTLAAGTYSVSLDAAQRGGGSSNQTVELLVDGAPVSSVTPTSSSYALYTTTTFTVTAGSHTIEILGLDPHGGDNTALIDQVSIVAAQPNQPLDPGFEAPSVGRGHLPVRSDGLPLDVQRICRRGRQRQRLHVGQSQRAAGRSGGVHSNHRLVEPVGRAGGRHVLDFARSGAGAIGPSNQTFEVLVDGVSVGSINPTGTSYAEYDTATFTVSSGAHTIELLGLDPHGGDNTALVDQVFLNWV